MNNLMLNQGVTMQFADIIEAMRALGWKPVEYDTQRALLMAPVGASNYLLYVRTFPDEAVLHAVAVLPDPIPETAQPRLRQYLQRINLRLPLGHFFIAPENGAMSFRMDAVPGTGLSATAIDHLLCAARDGLHHFAKAVPGLLDGSLSVEDAIHTTIPEA